MVAGSLCVQLMYSPWLCVGFRWVLQLPPTVQEHDPEEHRIHAAIIFRFYFFLIQIRIA